MEAWRERGRRLWEEVLNLCFPLRCPCCGKVNGTGEVCGACLPTLPWTRDEERLRTLHGGVRCCGALWYEGSARDAVLALKFRGRSGSARVMGEWIARAAAEAFSGEFDAVTWVPVSRKRRRSRGYDQAELLARSACRLWDTAPVRVLEKTVDNPAQSGLREAAARRANVLGVYRAVDPEQAAGRRFLLVDDVCTTGATLGECVRVLREAGAAEVVCAVAALSPGEGRTGEKQA